MQVMNEDAKRVKKVTGLKLTMAGEQENSFIIGGFPKSGLDLYIGKLARACISVAIDLQDKNKENSWN